MRDVFDIVYSKQARAALRQHPAKCAARILKILEMIAVDPFARHSHIEPIKGVAGGFRYRLGDWRVLYHVDTEVRILTALDIRPRGGAYR